MQTKYTPKDIERFWGKVDKEKSTTFYNGIRCWEWSAPLDKDGYGKMKLNLKNRRAHRLSFQIHIGSIPDGLSVLHKCDNPPCVNPEHLFLGTTQDNMSDRNKKGRQAKGEDIGIHKLTEEQVSEIRKQYSWFGKGGKSTISLSKEFGVSQVVIWRIVKNKGWT